MNGIEKAELAAGGTYLKVHHYADPEKDSQWLAQMREEFKENPRGFEVEFLMKELNLDGLPVYAGFEEEIHAPLILNTKWLEPEPYSQFVIGWDAGTASINPAAILLEITPMMSAIPFLRKALLEFTTEPGVALVEFVPAVLNGVRERYKSIDISKIFHGCDESGRARNGVTGETAFDVMRKFGVNPVPVSNQWQNRRASVDRMLADRFVSGDKHGPKFVVNRQGCPVLLNGFLGSYRLRHITGGASAGQYGDPVKDEFSHIHDGLQYASIIADQMTVSREVTKRKRNGDLI